MKKVFYDLKLNRQLLQLLSKSGHVAKSSLPPKEKSYLKPEDKRLDN